MKKLILAIILFTVGCQPPTPTLTGLLICTTTGEHGYVGQASAYDVRYSAGILNDVTWVGAYQFKTFQIPKPSGQVDTIKVTGLYEGATYSFAIKVGNKDGQWSNISNIVTTTIRKTNQVIGVVHVYN